MLSGTALLPTDIIVNCYGKWDFAQNGKMETLIVYTFSLFWSVSVQLCTTHVAIQGEYILLEDFAMSDEWKAGRAVRFDGMNREQMKSAGYHFVGMSTLYDNDDVSDSPNNSETDNEEDRKEKDDDFIDDTEDPFANDIANDNRKRQVAPSHFAEHQPVQRRRLKRPLGRYEMCLKKQTKKKKKAKGKKKDAKKRPRTNAGMYSEAECIDILSTMISSPWDETQGIELWVKSVNLAEILKLKYDKVRPDSGLAKQLCYLCVLNFGR